MSELKEDIIVNDEKTEISENAEKIQIPKCDEEIAQKLIEIGELENQRMKSQFTNAQKVRSD